VVLRISVVTLVAIAALACAAPPMPSSAPEPTGDVAVTARWAADDGSVVAVNVVVAAGTDRHRLPALAQELRRAEPRGRLIVTFFDEAVGPERYVIGHMPAGDEAIVTESRGPAWLGTFDFPRGAPEASGLPSRDGQRIDASDGPIGRLHLEPGAIEEPPGDRRSQGAVERIDDVALGERDPRERAWDGLLR
jgi:hypothetical protein